MASFGIYKDTQKENPKNLKGDAKQPNHVPKRTGLTMRDTNAMPAERGGDGNIVVPKDSQVAQNHAKDGHLIVPMIEKFENPTTTTAVTFVNNENVHQEIYLKNDSFVNDFDGIVPDEGSVVSSTPMSISDILSPMSIDLSTSSAIDPLNEHQANSNDIYQQQEPEKNQDLQINEVQNVKQERDTIPLPRNDRQRFFEVVEYQMDILEHFHESEKKTLPNPKYMEMQREMNYIMRSIIIDYLVEVAEDFKLNPETLYLSISYMDRFLSRLPVARHNLQLLGVTAMLIASKYEEIYAPSIEHFLYITDDAYTKAEVARMEKLVLKALRFELCTPTPYVFVNLYAVMTDMSADLKYLTMYICELSLLDGDPYLRYVPSLISAAAHALARYILGYPMWTVELELSTKYKLEDFKEVFLNLCKTHREALKSRFKAIPNKYKGEKYNAVANFSSVEFAPVQYDIISIKYNEISANRMAFLKQQQQVMFK